MRQKKESNIWKHHCKLIKKICGVLRIIDISTFLHIRVNKENNFFVLSDNLPIIKHCLRERDIGDYLREVIKNSMLGKISINLWPVGHKDLLISRLAKLNIANGISLLLRFGDYIDIFSFATDIKNNMKDFYLNHIRLLKRFVIYFRLKARKFIDITNKNKWFP